MFKVKIDKIRIRDLALTLLVLLTTSSIFFYLVKTERINADFVASIFKNQEKAEELTPELEDSGFYWDSAKEGEGLTHIARRAINEAIQEEIGAERRVFAEDYIQKSLGSKELLLEEEVSISYSLIYEAIELSFELSEEKIENLKQYSSLISFNLT